MKEQLKRLAELKATALSTGNDILFDESEKQAIELCWFDKEAGKYSQELYDEYYEYYQNCINLLELRDFIVNELTLSEPYDFSIRPDQETISYLLHDDKLKIMREIVDCDYDDEQMELIILSILEELSKEKREVDKMNNISFCIYLPEAHGFRTSSNGGNYAEYVDFKIDSGKYYIRYSSSGDGDIFPYPDWEQIAPDEFVRKMAQARAKEDEESRLFDSLLQSDVGV
jgi:hypothetical protein